MGDINNDSKSSVDSESAIPARPDKRGREYGMYPDFLVDDRSIKGREEVQEKLNAIHAEGRWLEIYKFIHKYRPGTPHHFGRVIRGGYNGVFPLFFDDGTAA
ncbi:hypothetical protein C8A03DRAFT_39453, partial [Achaetomium macrosporum]